MLKGWSDVLHWERCIIMYSTAGWRMLSTEHEFLTMASPPPVCGRCGLGEVLMHTAMARVLLCICWLVPFTVCYI